MKVLVADDDAVTRLLLAEVLRAWGHLVTVVENGRQAWQALERDHFSVLISDWMMPELDGPALCRLVRGAVRSQYTYVILLTALDRRAHYLEGMEAGADDFVTKPFDPGELRVRLRVAERILGLQGRVQALEGLLPVCMYCKRVDEGGGRWTQIEQYVAARTEAAFSHGICPECFETQAKPDLDRWKASRAR